MTVQPPIKTVAFLATGNELTQGDLQNTNSTQMAQSLEAIGIHAGQHLMVDDDQHHIEVALNYLKTQHQAIIITGGLGPTSDDRTRDSVANAVDRALVFHEKSWIRIEQYFQDKNINLSDNNRKQAFFPEGSEIFTNTQGTADGCGIITHDCLIFLLPGPPRECLPMFEQHVIPLLIQHHFQTNMKKHLWRLLGVGESTIAHELDPWAKKHHIELGYRAFYPYVDVKYTSYDRQQDQELIAHITDQVAPYLVTTTAMTAQQLLKKYLDDHPTQCVIHDLATHGALAAALNRPGHLCVFDHQHHSTAKTQINIHGLAALWQQKLQKHTELTIEWHHQDSVQTHSDNIPLRGDRTLTYAVEWCCLNILKYLQGI